MTSKIDEALDKLKHSGIRMTPQRHAILSYLMNERSHPSADEIYKALEHNFPSMSVATVYNNLKVFIDYGLVRELTYGDDASRYDADMSEHYHAICERCGEITDFDYPRLKAVEEAAFEQTGFQPDGHRLEIYGICKQCADITKH
ncbi:Fur family transcriptional regulator [Ferviditalea candida]|uniref:Fur family transcriptional regulator n=1 Tax=Ferviditalea candida TaxID=3108399 RepID=A0ABU5ZI21_9BACL|nr:Fur family transcriptional regulator [Paenibacillaceae bacterium T2]